MCVSVCLSCVCVGCLCVPVCLCVSGCVRVGAAIFDARPLNGRRCSRRSRDTIPSHYRSPPPSPSPSPFSPFPPPPARTHPHTQNKRACAQPSPSLHTRLTPRAWCRSLTHALCRSPPVLTTSSSSSFHATLGCRCVLRENHLLPAESRGKWWGGENSGGRRESGLFQVNSLS